MTILFIHWNPDPAVFSLLGFSVRWYSLCWVLALGTAYLYMHRLYRMQRIPDQTFEPLFIYCFVGVLAGARLGHCLFYEPAYYLSHPVEMLLPVKADPEWHFTGYEGLASHGGVIGLFLALILYARKTKMPGWHILDNMGLVAPLAAGFIRLGNLMNSEIVGQPTDLPWGFVFVQNGEDFARHPAQLYEALFYFALAVIFLLVYRRRKALLGSGFYFGLCLACIFAFRFQVEFIKKEQVHAELDMAINIGQWLSLPLILAGVWSIRRGLRKQKK